MAIYLPKVINFFPSLFVWEWLVRRKAKTYYSILRVGLVTLPYPPHECNEEIEGACHKVSSDRRKSIRCDKLSLFSMII